MTNDTTTFGHNESPVGMRVHPAANIFPMMDDRRLGELAQDIRENGQREQIRLLDGEVLDGRNRLAACDIAGVKPNFVEVATDVNPWVYVWSLNGQRRDLTPEIRFHAWKLSAEGSAGFQAEIKRIQDEANKARAGAAKAGEVGRASKRKQENIEFSRATWCGTTKPDNEKVPAKPEKPTRTSEKKAEASGTDRGTVERMEWLEKHRPDLHTSVIAGEFQSAKAVSIAKKEAHAADIQQQRDDIDAGTLKLPDGVFEVVTMDPPWNYGREYDPSGSRVANPYPEMTQSQLLELQPPFADDCVIFLWTTHQFIWDAKELLDTWGFTYKANLVWDKEKIGMGAWLRMQCEFCLVGIKGKPTWQNTRWRDVIREPRRQHSRKPEVFYQMVEEITVGRRLEYFSRGGRPGWEAFGNDTQKF